ncbi:discoidin domain-containing protein, partial [Streptomyces sp. NPDC002499]
YVYYQPEQGENMKTADVTVPVIQDLVDLNGTRSQPVKNVSFEGLTFSYSTWLEPSSADGLIEGQAGFRMVGKDNPDFDSTRLHWKKTPGAVNVSYGQGIGFEGNTFTHLGAVGLNLNTGTQHTDITGNVFREIAATGIQIGGVDWSDAHPDDPRDITKDTRVDNNVVTQVADQYNGSLGILAGYTDSTVITHNKVYDLPYSGISVGWGWGLTDKGGNTNYLPGNLGVPISDKPTTSRNNVVADNEISDIMKSQADGGAIYTLSDNPGGTVSGNYIHGVPSLAYGAVYHDEGSRHWSTTGNAFCDVAYQWMFMNHAMDGRATGNFTTNPAYSTQSFSTNDIINNNVTVGACDQLPASIVNNAGLEAPYRHLDPGPAVTDHRAPSTPGTPTGKADFPTVADLNWPASTDNTAVTGYSVFQDGKLVNASATPAVRIPGLTAGKAYTFKVTARDAAGNASAPSKAIKVTMPDGKDLALGKPATASSKTDGYEPGKAVDGDPSTRWAQGPSLPDPSWIQVDLGGSYDVSAAITTFEKASGYKYRIEVSPDEVHWKTLSDRTGTNTTAQTNYDTGTPVTGRYVRLTVTGSSGNGGSVYDLQVYGGAATPSSDHTAPSSPGRPEVSPLLPSVLDLSWPAATDDTGVTSYVVYQDGKRIAVTGDTTLRVSDLSADTQYTFTVVARDVVLNESEPSPAATVTTPDDSNDLALGKPATASSKTDGYEPGKAVDGDPSTRWAQGSGLPDPSWIQVDLGDTTTVTGVVTTFEKSSGYKYRVEYSTDGETWSLFDDHTSANTTSATSYALADHPVTARYLRLTVTGSNFNGGSIYELQVYGGF